jgi:hypothetical protein
MGKEGRCRRISSLVSTGINWSYYGQLLIPIYIHNMAIEDLLAFQTCTWLLPITIIFTEIPSKRIATFILLLILIYQSVFHCSTKLDDWWWLTQHPRFNFHPLTEKTFGYKKYLNMYKDIYLNLVNPSIIDPYIDSIVNMIRTDVDWDAALPKIGNPLVHSFQGRISL